MPRISMSQGIARPIACQSAVSTAPGRWAKSPAEKRAAGGSPFHTTQTNAVEFPGGASFSLFVGRSFSSDTKSMPRSGTPFVAPFPRVFEFRPRHRARSAAASPARRTTRCIPRREITACLRRQNLYQTRPSQSVQVLANFVQLVLVLHQICSSAQLLSPRLCAAFERKPKHETANKIATCKPVPQRGTAARILFPRAVANSNRHCRDLKWLQLQENKRSADF
jgi:hypothetical protein